MRKRILLAILIIASVLNTVGVFPASASASNLIITRTGNATTETQRVRAGDTVRIDISVRTSQNYYPISDFTLEFVDLGTLVQVGSGLDVTKPLPIIAERVYTFEFRVPVNSPRQQDIRYSVYASEYEDIPPQIFSVTVEIIEGDGSAFQPILENVRASNNTIPANEAFTVSADIFNGSERITEAVFSVSSGGTELARRFIGTVSASDIRDEQLTIPGFDGIGAYVLAVTLSFRDSEGERHTITRNLNITVAEPRVLLENVRLNNSEILQNGDFVVATDIFNGTSDITGVTLAVYNGETQLARRFISPIIRADDALLDSNITVPGIAVPGNYNLKLRLYYSDKNNVNLSSERNIPAVRVVSSAGNTDGLNIQSLSVPIRVETDTKANMSFFLTNPTTTTISGVEAFLFDSGNNPLTSVYISEIAANTSVSIPLEFPVTGGVGVRNYSLSVSYTNASNLSRTLTRSFSLTVSGEGFGGSDAPSDLRIQNIDAPQQLFTGARTNIPFTLVNAGRSGTAFNVEIYVIDEYGVELAREFIGSISAQDSRENTFPLRINSPDTYNLTFFAVTENADGSFSQLSRTFELKVIDYPLTINETTLSGHDWIWNNMASIEFGVNNAGNRNVVGARAALMDSEGNVFAETNIGAIEAYTERERVRFRDVFVWDEQGMGTLDMAIVVTYKIDDIDFSYTYNYTAILHTDVWDPGDNWWPPEDDWSWEEPKESGSPLWVIIIAGSAILIAGIVILIIVLSKRKKARTDDDDVDYFLSQLNVGALKNNEADSQKEEIHQ